MRYSVIIPIYNSEKTLRRCLDSLSAQLRDDIEVLLIDDGSTDNSFQICQTYAQIHPQLIPIHQENGGVSSARNRGLDLAQGDYILFVDSDDYVSEEYFSTIDNIICEESIDFVRFGSHHFGARNFTSKIESGNWIDDEIPNVITAWMKGQVLNSLWSKVFRKNVIEENHLRFYEALSISEDLSFIFTYSLYTKHVVCCSDVLYYVSEENESSLSRKMIEQLPQKLIQADEIMRAALHRAAMPENKKQIYKQALARNYYRSVYSSSKQLLKSEYSSKERRKEIRNICRLYSEKQIHPENIENCVIAIPVRLKMALLIDLMVRRH